MSLLQWPFKLKGTFTFSRGWSQLLNDLNGNLLDNLIIVVRQIRLFLDSKSLK
jgi:hypothetical protein